MSKQIVLERIQNALKKHPITHQEGHFKNIILDEKDNLLEEYMHFQELNRAEVVLSSLENLSQSVQEALESMQSQKVLHAMDLPVDMETLSGEFTKIPYDKEIEAFRSELFDIDTSIVKAACGVANLGIVGVVSSKQSPRLTSLITLKCIILLEKEAIVRDLAQGLAILKSQNANRLPTNMLFIGGPSRTADIELKTVFGVHGPMVVRVILY
ncbi:LutC/YkgG family protein [Helicobacter baculiformis]|uniref:LutC/YkgG family protein n=1 Tax=Helicobacter baculiformis TaxID=427351 RepID=UPI000CF0A288|nr:lactate utilization protein C [Helicobacter baculiformis]